MKDKYKKVLVFVIFAIIFIGIIHDNKNAYEFQRTCNVFCVGLDNNFEGQPWKYYSSKWKLLSSEGWCVCQSLTRNAETRTTTTLLDIDGNQIGRINYWTPNQ